jgi:hypothetical protein
MIFLRNRCRTGVGVSKRAQVLPENILLLLPALLCETREPQARPLRGARYISARRAVKSNRSKFASHCEAARAIRIVFKPVSALFNVDPGQEEQFKRPPPWLNAVKAALNSRNNGNAPERVRAQFAPVDGCF